MAVAPAPGDAHPLLDTLLERQNNTLQEGMLSIVVIGEPGTGKSTLVNNILGKEVAEVGHGSEPMTVRITSYEREGRDSTIKVYDTPSLCDPPMEKKRRLVDLSRLLPCDKIVICFKMIETRISPQIVQCFATYHRELQLPWDRVVIALTFADVVPTEVYKGKLIELRTAIKDLLGGPEIGVARRVVDTVPILPVTKSCDKLLPDRCEWSTSFSHSILAVPRDIPGEDQPLVIPGEDQPLVIPGEDQLLVIPGEDQPLVIPGEDQPRQGSEWLQTLALTAGTLVLVVVTAGGVYAVRKYGWKSCAKTLEGIVGHHLWKLLDFSPDNTSGGFLDGLHCDGVQSAVQNHCKESVQTCSNVCHKLSGFVKSKNHC